MVLANITGAAQDLLFGEDLYCSPDITEGIHSQITSILAINVFVSISATLGNTLILVALHSESSLHPPSKLLLRCLATSDLCVGVTSEPLAIIYWIAVLNKRWDICRLAGTINFISSYVLCSVSLLTLTAISADRLLALLLGLRYKQVVTLKRIYVVLSSFWVVSTVAATMSVWNSLITFSYGYIGIAVCLTTSVYCYTKIFLNLRQLQSQVQDHRIHREVQSVTSPLNISRYKKAVNTALWLQLTLVACYLPHGISGALMFTEVKLSPSVFIAGQCTSTLIYFNSSLNPILYCWKIKEVKQAVKDTIKRFCWFCR